MQYAAALAQLLSIIAFGGYGALTLLSAEMIAEFERYGLGRLRVLIAILQLLGSAGLIVGYFIRPVLVAAAGGFVLMMLLAVLVRVRIRDPLLAMAPAFVLLCINLVLLVHALKPV